MGEYKVDLLKNSTFETLMQDLIDAVNSQEAARLTPEYTSGIKVGTFSVGASDVELYVPTGVVGPVALETLETIVGVGDSIAAVQSTHLANNDDVTFSVYADVPNLAYSAQVSSGGILTLDFGVPFEEAVHITVQILAVVPN